jgi:hypothetical protein
VRPKFKKCRKKAKQAGKMNKKALYGVGRWTEFYKNFVIGI